MALSYNRAGCGLFWFVRGENGPSTGDMVNMLAKSKGWGAVTKCREGWFFAARLRRKIELVTQNFSSRLCQYLGSRSPDSPNRPQLEGKSRFPPDFEAFGLDQGWVGGGSRRVSAGAAQPGRARTVGPRRPPHRPQPASLVEPRAGRQRRACGSLGRRSPTTQASCGLTRSRSSTSIRRRSIASTLGGSPWNMIWV
jgi:hypothetical protein